MTVESSSLELAGAEVSKLHAEIEQLRSALKPFAEWDENDESTHGFLSDPAAWTTAKAAYFNLKD